MFYVRPGPEGPMGRTTPSDRVELQRPAVRWFTRRCRHDRSHRGRLDLDLGTSARLRRVTGLALTGHQIQTHAGYGPLRAMSTPLLGAALAEAPAPGEPQPSFVPIERPTLDQVMQGLCASVHADEQIGLITAVARDARYGIADHTFVINP